MSGIKRIRRPSTALVVIGALVGLMVLSYVAMSSLAPKAEAAVPGFWRDVVDKGLGDVVDDPLSPLSLEFQTECPEGRIALSAGAQVGRVGGGGVIKIGGSRSISITQQYRVDSRHWKIAAEETRPTEDKWGLQAIPICSLPLPGYIDKPVEMVSHTDTSDAKNLKVYCPKGKAVYGGGVQRSDSGLGRVTITDNHRYVRKDGREGWAGGAEEFEQLGDRKWTIKVYAICADPLPGLRTYERKSFSSSDGKSNKIECLDDAYGRRIALSGGFHREGGKFHVGIDMNSPSGFLHDDGTFDEQGWIADAQEIYPTGKSWNITTYVTCAYL